MGRAAGRVVRALPKATGGHATTEDWQRFLTRVTGAAACLAEMRGRMARRFMVWALGATGSAGKCGNQFTHKGKTKSMPGAHGRKDNGEQVSQTI